MAHVVKYYGPPGTGKTYTLMSAMKSLIEVDGISPAEMAFVTFTKNARTIARSKAAEWFGLSQDDIPYFATLHSLCFRLLGMNSKAVIRSTVDLSEFSRMYQVPFSELTTDMVDEDGFFVAAGRELGDECLAFDHFRRHKLIDNDALTRTFLSDWKLDVPYEQVVSFCRQYQRYKDYEGLIDFTDMLKLADDSAKRIPVKIVFVDEAQDLSKLQWSVLHTITRGCEQMHVAGDDDQAIFEWAGAEPASFTALQADETHVLDQSHRLPPKIHRVSTNVAGSIVHRAKKVFRPKQGIIGSVEHVSDVDEITPKHGESWLFLARNHWVLSKATRRLRELGLPYYLGVHSSLSLRTQSAISAYESARCGSVSKNDLSVMSHVFRGVDAALEAVKSATDEQVFSLKELGFEPGFFERHWQDQVKATSGLDLQYITDVVANCGSMSVTPTIRVCTIHAAKGSQADNVAVFGDVASAVLQSSEANRDSELRVWYVAFTRALERLILIGESDVIPEHWKS